MRQHIVDYDENEDWTKSRAKCSCGSVSTWLPGSPAVTWARLDQWAENHIEEMER